MALILSQRPPPVGGGVVDQWDQWRHQWDQWFRASESWRIGGVRRYGTGLTTRRVLNRTVLGEKCEV